mmetsp:Transcript_532/g.1504  ORF Transcript_532/g.1504 Transcript_532/m.1504 type:complete len:213 (+) Transcript_532:1151-1789(+)
MGDPTGCELPKRHHITSGDQQAVKRAGGGNRCLARRGRQHCRDHRINRRILGAHQVGGALQIGSFGSPIEVLLVPGAQRQGTPVIGHVEIISRGAACELRPIHQVHADINAHLAEGLHIQVGNGAILSAALIQQNGDRHHVTIRIAQLAVLGGPACLFHQRQSPAQPATVAQGAIGGGQNIAVHHTRKQPAIERGQEFSHTALCGPRFHRQR